MSFLFSRYTQNVKLCSIVLQLGYRSIIFRWNGGLWFKQYVCTISWYTMCSMYSSDRYFSTGLNVSVSLLLLHLPHTQFMGLYLTFFTFGNFSLYLFMYFSTISFSSSRVLCSNLNPNRFTSSSHSSLSFSYISFCPFSHCL